MEKLNELDLTKCLTTYANLFPINPSLIEGDTSIINEFTCILCLHIAYKPLLITCCSRIFCFSCSYSLLEKNGKCPFCYTIELLFEAPNKFIIRILNSFKLTCPFSGIFLKQSTNKAIVCNEHISHNYFHEHLLNKCSITKMLKDESNKGDFAFMKDKDDSDIKYLIKNIRLNYIYCNKCQLIDEATHNCIIKKVFNVVNQSQNTLIPFLAINKSDPEKKDPISSILHSHKLYFTNFRSNSTEYSSWNCDFCLKNINRSSTEYSYNCEQCDLDICSDCFTITLLKKPNKAIHEHILNIREDREGWTCNLCEENYDIRKSFHCSECDFDACIHCYFNCY